MILKSSDNAEPQSAKMLIMLPNGEQRLITFILPKESCTVQELLEQVIYTFMFHIIAIFKLTNKFAFFVDVYAKFFMYFFKIFR